MKKTVITFGTFDLFHVGHLNILDRASKLGDRLVVGVSSDKLNLEKKGVLPVYSEQERIRIISALRSVSEVFLEESLEKKAYYIKEYQADILAMGDDWEGKFDGFSSLCSVVYFPRTPIISTTATVQSIRERAPIHDTMPKDSSDEKGLV